MSLHEGKEPIMTPRIRPTDLAVDQMEKLKDSFESTGSSGLDIDQASYRIYCNLDSSREAQFVEMISSVLGRQTGSRKELRQLFMKIDANSDGSVDWDEFTNYIISENQTENDQDHVCFQTSRLANVTCLHA